MKNKEHPIIHIKYIKGNKTTPKHFKLIPTCFYLHIVVHPKIIFLGI